MISLSLSPDQVSELDTVMQSKECSKRYFKRLQSVKLNAKGYSLPQISVLLEVHYNSVYHWITRYKKHGVIGLKDTPPKGRPPLLTQEDKPLVEAFLRENPQQPKVVIARIEKELGKTISTDTLRRALKSMDHSYRRVKKSLKSKRDENAFAAKKKRSKP